MVIPLIASALLLDFLGCMMPLSWIKSTRGIKTGVFLIWLAHGIVSVLMGMLYQKRLAAVNPLLTIGFESICLVCAMYPLFGIAMGLTPHSAAQINTLAVLALLDLLVATVGYGSLLLGTVWLIFF